jgi:ABC-type bacteriocin/lantibiotic exporter with double-glycine peptidase domain
MVLECFGYFEPEAYLRQLLECDESGTRPEKMVEAVKEHFGLMKSEIGRLTLDKLQEEISRGLYPIVYLDLLDQGVQNAHAVIVTEIAEDKIRVVDPYYDENDGVRAFELAEFNRAWMAVSGRTIIISR